MMSPFHRHDLGPLVASMRKLYGARADESVERLCMMAGRYGLGHPQPAKPYAWSQRDAVLITYGDSVSTPGEHPLATLRRFLDTRTGDAFNTVHVLPFFPSSSDDGFSVIHFRRVDPSLGDWPDIQALGATRRLMVDLVINHVSRSSGWFQDFDLGIAPARFYILTADPGENLHDVVRPRSHPLLTPVQTREGLKHVWTTFSSDQVDLDFRNPDVFFEMLDILLFYVSMGARIIRLDAIAYLWKKPGTPCIHLEETHEVVRAFRDFLEMVAPDVLLLTETNVPHEENISYFGQGDEAHMVYQFSLPPLLLHACATGSATTLSAWARQLAPPPAGCTFFNFTASHDGIGVRPLQGLVDPKAIDALVDHVKARGGLVSMKRNSDGTESPYELNITWFDAMRGPPDEDGEIHLRRFLCSQAVPLALRGVPALYVNALLASPNDTAGVAATGRARSINRRKWTMQDLDAHLDDRGKVPAHVVTHLVKMLELRSTLPAFHPDAPQRILDEGAQVFAVERVSPNKEQRVLALHNVSPVSVTLSYSAEREGLRRELLTGRKVDPSKALVLAPYCVMWLGA